LITDSKLSVGELDKTFMHDSIHGRCRLPKGYRIIVVPRDATFEDDDPNQPDKSARIKISSNYNSVKVLIALGQTLFATTTVYRSKGDQITRFGYAAFGLTVAPYAFMSVINLFGHLMCPDYSTKYLVESAGLRHLREHSNAPQGFNLRDDEKNILVEGVVGKLTLDADRKAQSTDHHGYAYGVVRHVLIAWSSLILGIGVPLAIIGGISGFHKGSSTHAQRVWTMCWLAFGVFMGFTETYMSWAYSESQSESGHLMFIGMAATYGTPAIGGLVVVGQMISNYGVCTRIS
jgi:hypothetical protein